MVIDWVKQFIIYKNSLLVLNHNDNNYPKCPDQKFTYSSY